MICGAKKNHPESLHSFDQNFVAYLQRTTLPGFLGVFSVISPGRSLFRGESTIFIMTYPGPFKEQEGEISSSKNLWPA